VRDHEPRPSIAARVPRERTGYLLFAAGAILLITMGARQSLGLFVRPLSATTGLGIVAISFALAIGQFVWGLAQPVFGAIADRFGSGAVLRVGALMLAAGAVLTTVVSSELGLTLAIGVLFAAGAGAGSFSTLIGVTARSIAPAKRAFASGVINAGGSLGQFVLAPVSQFIIGTAGWVVAMYALALADAARAARHRGGRSQLLVSACRVLHLRLPHCVPGDASAG
jgi:MFS family permease